MVQSRVSSIKCELLNLTCHINIYRDCLEKIRFNDNVFDELDYKFRKILEKLFPLIDMSFWEFCKTRYEIY